ncbi:MAG: CBS domain-containing protein, partial [bacterium]
APVVDSNDKLVGVVSLSDIVRNDGRRTAIVESDQDSAYYLHGWEAELDESEVRELHVEQDDGLSVADIMTPIIFKVPETAAIAEMAETMISGRIHRLLVTCDDKVVGIVTTLDMLKTIRHYTR